MYCQHYLSKEAEGGEKEGVVLWVLVCNGGRRRRGKSQKVKY
jgi:hypothetical protein